MTRINALLFALLLVLISLLPVSSQVSTKIDPRVMDDTADGAIGNFIVVLNSQAPVRDVARSTSDPIARGRVVYDALKKAADATQPAVRAQLDSLGAKYRAFYIVNAMAVEGNRAVVDALAVRADVLAIEPDRAFRVPLEQPATYAASAPTTIEWNVNMIGAPAVWAAGYTGQGMVYANGDTGVQWDHPALKPHYRGWNGTTANHNFNWWDAIKTQIDPSGNICGYDLQAPCDDFGHGTHTMGTGIGDDGAGNQIGVAPGAKWIACRNMDNGTGRPSTYIGCYQFFLAPTDLNGNNANPDLRPDAIGNSYTCPPSELCATNSLLASIENLRAVGVFMSVSAGNSGSFCSTITEPPAIYDWSATIGATDSKDSIASFSSRGPVTIDGSNRRKPDLSAPGVGVRSSVPFRINSSGYAGMSGTSMAAPHVAGAVVLLWSAFPQLRHQVDVTENILEQSAVKLTTSQGCGGDSSSQVPNNVYGYGRVDVLSAYNAMVANPAVFRWFFPMIMRGN